MSEPMKEKIFEAIEKARGEGFSELKKSGKNPAFSSKYSTLMDVFDSCKKPLEENGIHISFTTEVVNMNDRIENLLVCTLYHLPSGEKLQSKVSCLDDTKKGSQAIGSGITYMRRYLLQSMLNLGRGLCSTILVGLGQCIVFEDRPWYHPFHELVPKDHVLEYT